MKKFKITGKLLCFLFVFVFTAASALPVSAAELPASFPEAPDITDETGVLMELESGQVLFDKGMDEIRYPASTTKVMTALLILESIEDLNQTVTFTDVILPDLAPGNSTINAQVGETLTVEQCLYAIMLASANEVCTQMAVQIAGSVNGFVAMMNQRAQELGCKNTHFVNANGLPDPNHYTTAYDLALILAEAVKNESFCKIAGAAKYTIPVTNKTPYERNLENHNSLLTDGDYHYDGAIAGKTGHTEAAKNTLVTAAARDDMTLICVVMRSDGDARFTDTISLFDYGFDNFQKYPLYWESTETPSGYVILPSGIDTGNLQTADSVSDGTATRTYFYQGTALQSITVPFPMETETQITSDMSLVPQGTWQKHLVPLYLLPVMSLLLAAETAACVALVIRNTLQTRRKKARPA